MPDLSPTRPSPKPLIVVVEDEPELASLIAQHLELAGMRVQVCNRAAHALKFLQRNFANLVLMDLVLPDQGGFELYEDLKAANINVPVIFVTANMEEGSKGSSRAAMTTSPSPSASLSSRHGSRRCSAAQTTRRT
jgi:CheY-like chemotaxis protein